MLVSTGIISISLLAGHQFIAELIGEPELTSYLLLGSVFVVFNSLTSFLRVILQSFEKIKFSSALYSVNKIGNVIFAVGFVLLGYGAIGALVGYLISYIIILSIGMTYLFYFRYRKYRTGKIEPFLRRRIIQYSLPIAVTQSAHTLDHYIDRILLGFFIGPLAVAYYTVGKQVVQAIETPMSALGYTLSPTYSSQRAQDDVDTAANLYETACAYGILLYIPAATGLILLSEPGIQYVLGKEYLDAVPVLQVLAIYAVLQSITKLTGEGLDYLGRARARATIKGITALLNLILNLILIPLIGVVGAAIASVASFTLYAAFNVYIMYAEVGFCKDRILRRSGYAVFISAVMGIPVFLSLDYISGLPSLLFVVFVGFSVWAIMVHWLGLIDFRRIASMR
jgi:O-antigen/teichoic acid export membrane protein